MSITPVELPGVPSVSKNNQGQGIPAFPDGALILDGETGEYLFDTPVTLYSAEGGEVNVVPEARRKELNEILASYPEGEEFDDFEDASGLFLTFTIAPGGLLPFRVCAIKDVESSDFIAVY